MEFAPSSAGLPSHRPPPLTGRCSRVALALLPPRLSRGRPHPSRPRRPRPSGFPREPGRACVDADFALRAARKPP